MGDTAADIAAHIFADTGVTAPAFPCLTQAKADMIWPAYTCGTGMHRRGARIDAQALVLAVDVEEYLDRKRRTCSTGAFVSGVAEPRDRHKRTATHSHKGAPIEC